MTQKRIMIVEDEAINAASLQMVLKKSGYYICPLYASAEDAIADCPIEQPDLIILDIHLAGKMNGIEAALKIREFTDIPIIFLTGYSDPETLEQLASIKNASCVTKPTDPDHICTTVKGALCHTNRVF